MLILSGVVLVTKPPFLFDHEEGGDSGVKYDSTYYKFACLEMSGLQINIF